MTTTKWTVMARLGGSASMAVPCRDADGKDIELATESEAQALAAKYRDGQSRFSANRAHYFAAKVGR